MYIDCDSHYFPVKFFGTRKRKVSEFTPGGPKWRRCKIRLCPMAR